MRFPSPPRRVLMTADTIGGVWTFALELAAALARLGVGVTLATMGRSVSREQRAEAARIDRLDLRESTFALEWMPDPWDDVSAAGEWLLRLEEEIEPDVVHLNGYAHAALPWRAPVLVAAHSCVLSWWERVRRSAITTEWASYRDAVVLGLRAAEVVTAPSRSMAAALARHYGALQPAWVIPNARDPRGFRPATKAPFVLSAGRLWDEAKNLRALDRVAATVPWPVVVAGDATAPDRSSMRPQHVVAVGRLASDEVAALMSVAAVYALPARYEPFGLSVLEAALSGCALVLGDIDSLRENWDGAALFADPDDDEALAAAVGRLLSDGDERQRLADLARARAQAFTPERCRDGYLAAYAYAERRHTSCSSARMLAEHASHHGSTAVGQPDSNDPSSKEKAEGDRRTRNERVSEVVSDERDERDRTELRRERDTRSPREGGRRTA